MPRVVVRNFANGGVSTVRSFWEARLLDELHLVKPRGAGPLFLGADDPQDHLIPDRE